MVGLQCELTFGLVLDNQSLQCPIAMRFGHFRISQQLNLPRRGHVHRFLNAIEMAPKLLPAVNQRHFGGHAIRQENGPIQGRVSSTADHHPFPAI